MQQPGFQTVSLLLKCRVIILAQCSIFQLIQLYMHHVLLCSKNNRQVIINMNVALSFHLSDILFFIDVFVCIKRTIS